MAQTITILDQLPIGTVNHQFELIVQDKYLTARDLIRQRVHQEVSLYNILSPKYFNGLVQPSQAEQTLNGYKLGKCRQIDWEEQVDKAIEAFEQNGFFILVDDRQVENLDEVIAVRENTQVSFIKLVQLVGG